MSKPQAALLSGEGKDAALAASVVEDTYDIVARIVMVKDGVVFQHQTAVNPSSEQVDVSDIADNANPMQAWETMVDRVCDKLDTLGLSIVVCGFRGSDGGPFVRRYRLHDKKLVLPVVTMSDDEAADECATRGISYRTFTIEQNGKQVEHSEVE